MTSGMRCGTWALSGSAVGTGKYCCLAVGLCVISHQKTHMLFFLGGAEIPFLKTNLKEISRQVYRDTYQMIFIDVLFF